MRYVNMGITGSKKPKFFLANFSEGFEFEVCMPNYADNSTSLPQCPINIWCILKFVHKNSALIVIKDGLELNSINFDQNCEIINEQPEDFIFTIKFTDENKKVLRWKIRCKTFEEYSAWIKFLKKSLRHKWSTSSRCQVKPI